MSASRPDGQLDLSRRHEDALHQHPPAGRDLRPHHREDAPRLLHEDVYFALEPALAAGELAESDPDVTAALSGAVRPVASHTPVAEEFEDIEDLPLEEKANDKFFRVGVRRNIDGEEFDGIICNILIAKSSRDRVSLKITASAVAQRRVRDACCAITCARGCAGARARLGR